MTPMPEPCRLPGKTWLYFTAQSINLTTAVMSVTMAAMVGAVLAPTPALATVPYGFQFLLLMLATYPAARLMALLGRKRAFMLGALALVVAGLSGYQAVRLGSFALLVLSHSALGVYVAFANFNRFAATDGLPTVLKPRALSLVVAGGVVAAFVGPALTGLLKDAGGYPAFALCYASFVPLAALAFAVAWVQPQAPRLGEPARRKVSSPLPTQARLAMAIAALGYGIMNLLMIQASLHMNHMHTGFDDIRSAIQWHVIAMFAPSFFIAALISRIGLKALLCLGLLLLAGSSALNLMVSAHQGLTLALVVLGLGWNFTYVGGGALLAQVLGNTPQAMDAQGKNDLAIAICATLGAFLPSVLIGLVGWAGSNLLCLVLLAALLFATWRLLPGARSVSTPAAPQSAQVPAGAHSHRGAHVGAR